MQQICVVASGTAIPGSSLEAADCDQLNGGGKETQNKKQDHKKRRGKISSKSAPQSHQKPVIQKNISQT